MKKIISLFLLTLSLIASPTAYAQERIISNTVITQFGNAPLDQKPASTNTDLSKAAQNLIEAYSICPPIGKSDFVSVDRTECLQSFLKTRGYSDSVLRAFGVRRSTSITDAQCTECLGFVALALTLISGDINTLLGSPIESGVNIGNPLYVYNKLSQFPVGKFTYSITDRMEEGAVGMGVSHPLETLSGAGHALIVKKVLGNIKFIAYESSYNPICVVSDNREHPKDPYKFYNVNK